MSDRVLESPPSLASLFARAGTGAIPLASRLPLLGGGRPRASELPGTVLRLDGVEIDRARLARYDRVCGFGLRDRPPVTFPHVLAFPLQLALMTDPSFPFPAIGLVHIENEITQHRPIAPGEPLSLRVWAEDLRAHPRGRQFSLRTEVRAGDELVWEETGVNLRRGGGAGDGRGGGAADGQGGGRAEGPGAGRSAGGPDDPPELRETARWRLPGDLGRRYGAVAGDVNPIHLHPLSARLFGFPKAIAHGMWTKARCLAALEPRLPEAVRVSVRFRRPILLPSTVVFLTADTEGGMAFAVRSRSGTPHLEGEIVAL